MLWSYCSPSSTSLRRFSSFSDFITSFCCSWKTSKQKLVPWTTPLSARHANGNDKKTKRCQLLRWWRAVVHLPYLFFAFEWPVSFSSDTSIRNGTENSCSYFTSYCLFAYKRNFELELNPLAIVVLAQNLTIYMATWCHWSGLVMEPEEGEHRNLARVRAS